MKPKPLRRRYYQFSWDFLNEGKEILNQKKEENTVTTSMDVTECLSILGQRQRQQASNDGVHGCNHDSSIVRTMLECRPCPSTAIPTILSSLSILELITLLLSLQQERVETYREYDNVLHVLLQGNKLNEYPNLVAEITSIFTIISEKINNIKHIVKEKGEEQLHKHILSIQTYEKEKLVLIASKHLDTIQQKLNPDSQYNVLESSDSKGRSHVLAVTDPNYINKQIQALECGIMEEVDNVISLKAEYLYKN